MNLPVALVTGSTRGIGLAIARRLLEAGHFVVFNGVSRPDLPAEAAALVARWEADHGPCHEHVQADVSTPAGRAAMLDVIDRLGRVDLLVNNAGVAPATRKDMLDISTDDFARVIGTNLAGPYFLTQAVAKVMIRLASEGAIDGYAPKIVSISSISADTVSVNRGEYCIAKAGVSMMTALFAVRLAPHGIPVHEIRPGIIETDMTATVLDKYKTLVDGGLLPVARIGTPDDVAQAVIAIVDGRFPYSTGLSINVDGGFHLRRL